MSAMEDIHTDSEGQEARWAQMKRCDVIPYTAAGCQRQVSGDLRKARGEP